MHRRIPLVPHKRPRILTFNFTVGELDLFGKAGFNARGGSLGLEEGQYYCPLAFQDVEVLFVRLVDGGADKLRCYRAADESTDQTKDLPALVGDVAHRHGWIVVFVAAQYASELECFGIPGYGVRQDGATFEPAWKGPEPGRPRVAKFPRFRGQALGLKGAEPETAIIRKYIEAAAPHLRVLDTLPLRPSDAGSRVEWLATDEAASPSALAVKIHLYRTGDPMRGGVLLLPNFGDRTADVALDLLRGPIAEANPSLFDSPEAPWLNDYLPAPALAIENERASAEKELAERMADLESQREAAILRWKWLLDLLITDGDLLKGAVAGALSFLGYSVTDLDQEAGPKREDLRVTSNGYFALVEVKGTERGAAESFVGDLERYQLRYAREKKVSPPPGVLVVNHSRTLDPKMRAERFYRGDAIADRCKASGITALETLWLHRACQDILAGTKTREEVRARIELPGLLAAT